MLAVSVLMLLGAPLALGTGISPAPERARAAAAPTTTSSAPNPELCATQDAPPGCPPRGTHPDFRNEGCQQGEGCLPNPTNTKPGTDDGEPYRPKPGEPADECGITDPIACVTEGIDALFRGIVESALNPLLEFLSDTLLTTPTLDDLPQVGPLWDNSWQIVLACYTTLILVGGLIVMGHETLQTSYTAKEIAPRLVVGFLAGFLSLFFADQMIKLANGLSGALLGDGLDTGDAGKALRDMVLGALTGGGLFLLLLGLALAVMLVALLITYVVRVAFTVILLIGAPLALMCHALPHTEGIAKWWWKALAGVLAIQVAQSLTLIVALKVFFSPSGWTPFGPKPSGLVNLLVALALIYVLLKIPFWILSTARVGGSRSFVGSLAKGFLAYKTLGLLKGATTGGGATATRATATPTAGPSGAAATVRPGGGRPPRRPPATGSSGPTPPRSRPPAPSPDRPSIPPPSTLAPPIENTEWGRGRTAHDTRSAHEPSARASGTAPSPPGQRPPADPALRPGADRVQRAHDAARRAWQPLPGSSAVVAPPIESTPAGRGAPAGGSPPPPLPNRRRESAPSPHTTSRAADRFAQRPPPHTPISRANATPPQRQAPPPPGRGHGGKRVPLDLPGSHNPAPVKPARPPRTQPGRPGGSS